MPEPRTIVLEWIQKCLSDKKWTATDLTRQGGFGPSMIFRLIKRPKEEPVSLNLVKRIAETCGTTVPDHVAAVCHDPDPRSL